MRFPKRFFTRALSSVRPVQSGPPEWWLREHSMLWGTTRVPRSHARANAAIIGGIGSGKTTMLLIYIMSILGYIPNGVKTINAFVADPKNQLYRTLLELGLGLKVILTNVMDRRAWAWAIWRDLRDPVAASQFARDVVPEDKDSSSNKFFTNAVRLILAAVLSELIRLGRPFTLRHACLIAMMLGYARQLFEQSTDPIVRETLRLLDPNQGTAFANIQASILTKIADLATYAALMEHAPAQFSLSQMIRSDVIMVFGSDFRFAHILGPMNALMMNVLRQQLLSQSDVTDESRLHYMFIDEFAKLNYNAPAEDFPDFVELGRSKGIRTSIVIQTTEQIKKLYGPEGLGFILGQCQNRLIFRVSDHAGATECSNMIPFIHDYEWLKSSNGASESRVDRPLVPPDVIQQLPLADWGLGWRGIAIDAVMRRVPVWQFQVTPDFLAQSLGRDRARDLIACEREELACEQDLLLPYEQCTRPASEQYLKRLNPYECRYFGLDYIPDDDPDSSRP
jgi:hypothetical protein